MSGLSSFQALVTGVISGGLMKAADGMLSIDVEIGVDDVGNYTNELVVIGKESGERLRVTVDRIKEEEA